MLVLCILIHQRYGSVVVFLVSYSSQVLVVGLRWTHKMGQEYWLFFTFLEEFRRIGIHSSLSACCNSEVTLSGPGILTFGKVPDDSLNFVTISVSKFIFQFFLIQSREVIYFQELTHFIYIIEFGVVECFIVPYRIFCILLVYFF